MSRDRRLEARLRELNAPGEAEAEARAWPVVREAYSERVPVRPTPRLRRLVLVTAGGAAALAIGLSPAGAKVGDFVQDVVGIGDENAKPALRSLPAAGELLVESAQGAWIVREDGSKRLLGDYGQASWSPHGLFVAVADGHQLVAVDPAGNVRWTVSAPGRVADPRWSPSGFRIAYRSGDDLRVVGGDGTSDRLLARNVEPVSPAWRPIGGAKLSPDGTGSHLLSYATAGPTVRTIDVDTAVRQVATRSDRERVSTPSRGQRIGPASSPDGSALATIRPAGRRSELVLRHEGGRSQVLFSARGRLLGPAWSPDGRWLLVGWPDADQWLFIRAERPGRIVAFARVREQFDPGGDGRGAFPWVQDWILPQR